ncbi:MAG: hypothetical protein GY749_46995 [Desulfobacteraceae bacterium]|nr:hypothetical protein [Desulfobacteraceae bacterium]
MKGIRLDTKLNILFIIALFTPMIIGTAISIRYFRENIKEEAVRKIESDITFADLIWQNGVTEVEFIASSYARKKIVTILIALNFSQKVGNDLSHTAWTDDIDMVTVIDSSYKVLVRSHAPKKTGDHISPKKYIDEALAGLFVSGVDTLSADELKQESFEIKGLQSEKVLAITGAAPVYDRNRKQITGAIIVHRIIDKDSKLVSLISRNLKADIALFEGTNLVSLTEISDKKTEFNETTKQMISKAINQNKALNTADFMGGDKISMFLPLTDFTGKPVGVLMISRKADTFIRTRNISIAILLVISSAGFVLILIVKLVIDRHILKPIKYLKEKTSMFNPEDYTIPPEIRPTNEIEDLDSAFDKMAARLKKSHEALKAEIVERRQAEERIRGLHRELMRAQEKERYRIAYDLHDEIIQELSAVSLIYETILSFESSVSDEARVKIKETTDILKSTIRTIRKLAYGLQPYGIDHLGLVRFIDEFCMEYMRETGLPVVFRTAGMDKVELDNDTSINLYRLVQEIFSNIRKHSEATHVIVRLLSAYPDVILDIRDNGAGFDVNEVLKNTLTRKYMGIQSIKERVSFLDGNIKIESSPGEGTHIRVRFSNRNEDAEENKDA